MLYVTNMVSFVILRHPVTTLGTAFNNYCSNVSSDYGKFTSRYADIFILFKINKTAHYTSPLLLTISLMHFAIL